MLSHSEEINGGLFPSEELIQSSPKPKSHDNADSLIPLSMYDGCLLDIECQGVPPIRQQLQLTADLSQSFHPERVSTETSAFVLCSVQKTDDQHAGPPVNEGITPVTAGPSTSVTCGSNYAKAYEDVSHEHPTSSRKRERKRRCIRPDDAIKKGLVLHESPKRAHALQYLAIQYADSSDNEVEGDQEAPTFESPNVPMATANGVKQLRGCSGVH